MPAEGNDPALPSQFGRYTLVERLATGGMAEVFKAKIVSGHGFEKLLVIKRILPNLAADKTFVAMFIDEAKLTAQLVHPKIVQVTDFGEEGGQYFIALEFVDGFDGLALLRAAAQRHVRLPLAISMFIVAEVLDALDYAHNAKDGDGRPMHLVHRDISPSNVFISRRGDVKLGDFGIAHAQERESKTQAGTLKGKYGYMSPEQVSGGDIDSRSDLFAIGIVLAEMIMGKRLFFAANDLDVLLMVRDCRLERWEKYGQGVPAALEAIVRKSLAKGLEERFQSAAEFRKALEDLQFSLGVRVGPSDIGLLAADLFDSSDDALARLREHARKWELPQEPGASAVPPPLPGRARLLSDTQGHAVAHPATTDSFSAEVGSALDDAFAGAVSLVGLDQYQTPGSQPRAHPPPEPSKLEPLPGPGGAFPAVPPPAPGAVSDNRGELTLISPMRALADLSVAAETGLLRIVNGAQTRDVYLVRGAPESVNANLGGDRFGEYLVTRGFLRPSDLERALAEMGHFGGKLGGALVGLGFMRPLDVFRLLAQQVRERIIELFAWTEGAFAYYRNLRNPTQAFPLGLSSFEILGAGAVALGHDFLAPRLEPLMDFRPRAMPNPRISPEAFRLGPTPRKVLTLLDGQLTLRAWSERFASAEELLTFHRTLYLLVECSMAQFE
ncbi:MAG: serine/threonine-protein kinase [Polyangia bacterium]